MPYPLCLPYALAVYLLQVLCLITFCCSLTPWWWSSHGGGWVAFVSASALAVTTFLFVGFMLGYIYLLPYYNVFVSIQPSKDLKPS